MSGRSTVGPPSAETKRTRSHCTGSPSILPPFELRISLATKIRTEIGGAGPRGKGVFAAGLIRAQTTVASFNGRGKWIWDIPEEIWPYTIQVDYDRYVVPRRNGIAWYMNHSCEPNCTIMGTAIKAARDIREGEELTFDYSTDVDWPGFRMACKCGAPNCREVIRAYRNLPKHLKVRYGSNVAPFIRRGYQGEQAQGRSRSGPSP